MTAQVTGLGWVGSAGAGRRGDVSSAHFAPGRPAGVRLKDYLETAGGRAGRLDDYSRAGLVAAALALADAGLERWDEKRCGALVASTRYGCLPTDEEYFRTALVEGGAEASPNLFAYTLPNCFVGETALRFGLTGPTYVVSEAEIGGAPGVASIEEGLALLEEGSADFALCGFCDLGVFGGERGEGQAFGGAAFLLLEPLSEEKGGQLIRSSSSGAVTVERDGVEVEYRDFYQLVAALAEIR